MEPTACPQATHLTGKPADLGDVPLNFKCHVSDNSGVRSDHLSTGTLPLGGTFFSNTLVKRLFCPQNLTAQNERCDL